MRPQIAKCIEKLREAGHAAQANKFEKTMRQADELDKMAQTLRKQCWHEYHATLGTEPRRVAMSQTTPST
jgi:hypothetical protein